MRNFVYFNPTKLVFGKGVNDLSGKEIARNGYKRVILIAGSGSIKENGVYEAVTMSLKNAQIKWHEVWGVRANPVLSTVREAIAHARSFHADVIVAVGGGSVIDTAKATAAGVYIDDIWDVFEEKVKIKKALPIFCVVTLSATGSEMNPYAVITNEEEGKKWSTGGEALYPMVSFIDPEVQRSLPKHQTVFGAIDAISHCLEYYFLGNGDEVILALNETLQKSIIEATDMLVIDPQNYNARANLAWAATMALNGITAVALRGGDWASHAIEHGISALHSEVAHGAGLSVVVPAWITTVHTKKPELFARWAREVWGVAPIEEGIVRFKEKLSSWEAPITLRELHITESDIPHIADNVCINGYRPGVLHKFDRNDVETLLRNCL